MPPDMPLHEPKIEFFTGATMAVVERLLERARQRAENAAMKRSGGASSNPASRELVKALNTAVAAHSRSAKQGASIRQTAPDTGGRPYHFSYEPMTKERKHGGGSKPSHGFGHGIGASNAATGTGSGASGSASTVRRIGRTTEGAARRGSGRADNRDTAHQHYIEREGAVDHEAPALEPAVEPAITVAAEEAQHSDAIANVVPSTTQGLGRTPVDAGSTGRGERTGNRTAEVAAQYYMEDSAKVPRLMGRQSSFGTIGDTLSERVAFWDLVHEREREGGRTQTRMILELPHEATAEQRHEMIRLFTDRLRRRDIPFWATIHIPTGHNDDRNHHAHVVCTERPMRKIPHPATGVLTWDFAIPVETLTKCRHKVVSYPYRRNRDPEMRKRSYVADSRKRLAEVVNAVMSHSGSNVRYDPRSYKDMGLEIAPISHVRRKVADKVAKGSVAIMDEEWARRRIAADLATGERLRDEAVAEVQDAETKLQNRVDEAVRTVLECVAQRFRLSPGEGGPTPKSKLEKAFHGVQQLKRDRVGDEFAERATKAVLNLVRDATAPDMATKFATDGGVAIDMDDLQILHAAALEELSDHENRCVERRRASEAEEERISEPWRAGIDGADGRVPQPHLAETDDPATPSGLPPEVRRFLARTMNEFTAPLRRLNLTGQAFVDALNEFMANVTRNQAEGVSLQPRIAAVITQPENLRHGADMASSRQSTSEPTPFKQLANGTAPLQAERLAQGATSPAEALAGTARAPVAEDAVVPRSAMAAAGHVHFESKSPSGLERSEEPADARTSTTPAPGPVQETSPPNRRVDEKSIDAIDEESRSEKAQEETKVRRIQRRRALLARRDGRGM